MINNISEIKKDINLENFLEKCKIPGIGKSISNKIATKVINLATLRDLLEENTLYQVLKELPEMNDDLIGVVNSNLKNLDFMLLLEDMEDNKYSLFEDDFVYPLEDLVDMLNVGNFSDFGFLNDLSGIKICITGTLNQPRKYFEQFIFNHKGLFQSSVTASTDILIYSPMDGVSTTKYKKATSLKNSGNDIKIITESEFWNFVKFKI